MIRFRQRSSQGARTRREHSATRDLQGACDADFDNHLDQILAEIRADGLFKTERAITSPQGARSLSATSTC